MLRRGLRKQQREWCSPDTVSTFQDTTWSSQEYQSLLKFMGKLSPNMQSFGRKKTFPAFSPVLWTDETPLGSIPILSCQFV